MNINEMLVSKIRSICTSYPKQFSKILHAKCNAELLKYIDSWCEHLNFDGMSFATKVYYSINGITNFPVCKECGKPIVKNVYRLFDSRLEFCNQVCKHRNTIKTKGINRSYKKKDIIRLRKSNAYIIPVTDDYTDSIKDIVAKYPHGFMNIFRHRLNLHVLKWLDLRFPQLKTHKLSTKINWVLHGIVDFPVCEHCGKKLDYDVNPTRKYPRFCCNECVCRHNSEDPIIRGKQRDTMLANYGVECALQTDYAKTRRAEVQALHNDEITAAAKLKKLELYGDPNWNNQDQMRRTKSDKYGDSYWNNSEKAKQTYMDHRMADPQFVERKTLKQKATCKKLYGDENYHNEEQGKKTRLDRYGHINPAHGSNESKVRSTMRMRYGVDYAFQSTELIKKARSKYMYAGFNFDSATELYVYLYMEDSGIDFIYKPDVKFEYEYCGKTHFYHPDFFIKSTGDYVEIKGDQFFNRNGIMTCPYRNKNWTDGQYNEKCRLYAAKHACMIEHRVRIIRYKSFCIQNIMKCINKKFGKNYVKNFKTVR